MLNPICSAHVAQYTEYAQSLIDHLVHCKLGHWDRLGKFTNVLCEALLCIGHVTQLTARTRSPCLTQPHSKVAYLHEGEWYVIYECMIEQSCALESPTHLPLTCTSLSVVLPHLIPLVVTSDPRLRHGALHAVAEITSSLHSLHCSPSHSLLAVLGEGLVEQLVDLVPQVRQLQYPGSLC